MRRNSYSPYKRRDGKKEMKKKKILFCYISNSNRAYVEEMRGLFKTSSNYINNLIENDRTKKTLKKEKLKSLKKIKNLSEKLNAWGE